MSMSVSMSLSTEIYIAHEHETSNAPCTEVRRADSSQPQAKATEMCSMQASIKLPCQSLDAHAYNSQRTATDI